MCYKYLFTYSTTYKNGNTRDEYKCLCHRLKYIEKTKSSYENLIFTPLPSQNHGPKGCGPKCTLNLNKVDYLRLRIERYRKEDRDQGRQAWRKEGKIQRDGHLIEKALLAPFGGESTWRNCAFSFSHRHYSNKNSYFKKKPQTIPPKPQTKP